MSNENRILYVDSEENYREMMKHCFSEFGVTAVSNLEDALNAAREKNFDVYISDSSYPMKEGEHPTLNIWKKFYEELTGIKGKAPFILYSEYLNLIAEAESLGIKAFNKSDIEGLTRHLENMEGILE